MTSRTASASERDRTLLSLRLRLAAGPGLLLCT